MGKWKVLFITTLMLLSLAPTNNASSRRDEIDFSKVVNSMAMVNMNIPDLLLSNLLIDCLLGANPFILQKFGQLVLSVLDVGNLINSANPGTSLLNAAFSKLNLGFSQLSKLFTDLVPVTFELFQNLGISILDLLSTILKSISNDIISFLRLVELLNLNPTDLQDLLLVGTEQSIFSLLSQGTFSLSGLLEIADILNIDLSFSGVLTFFNLFNFGFLQKFTSYVTNDLFKLLNVLGVAVDALKEALSLLNVVGPILNLEFIQNILGLLTSQKLFANLITPMVAVTKKGNALLALFMNLAQYTQLTAIPLGGGGAGFPITVEDFGNFTKLVSLNALTSTVFEVVNSVAQRDLAQCVVTELVNMDVVGVVTHATFEGGLFKIPKQGISQLVEGTPLVCSGLLMGILDSIDDLVIKFRPLQPMKVTKTYEFRNPFFDIITRILTFSHYGLWLILVNIYLMLKDYVVDDTSVTPPSP